MRLFDCTLRDGANVVGNGFSAELTENVINGLFSCGIYDIELGNAKGIGAYDKGAIAPLSDEEYMHLVAPYAKQGRLGMFQQANLAEENTIKKAADYGLSFLRVGLNAGNGKDAIGAIKMVKNAGLTCRYSLMKAYVLTPEELASEARMLQDAGVDMITIMDSAGTMYPEDVSTYVQALKNNLEIPVGFHGHSNLGLSQANALAAAAANVDEIDCGLLGMARSAGNCSTEVAAATLEKAGYSTGADLYKLLGYLDKKLIPAMKEYDYHVAITPLDLVLGLSGCHSNYMPMFTEVAEKEHVDLFRLIIDVSAIDRKAPSKELLYQVAKQLK